MTAEEFSRDENNRVQLQRMLDSPVLNEAIQVLLDELTPTPGNEGVGNPVVSAARYQQLAGANHIVRGLRNLVQTPKVRAPLPVKRLLPENPAM